MDYVCQILDPQTERDSERQGSQAFGCLLADTTFYVRDRARLARVSFPATWERGRRQGNGRAVGWPPGRDGDRAGACRERYDRQPA